MVGYEKCLTCQAIFLAPIWLALPPNFNIAYPTFYLYIVNMKKLLPLLFLVGCSTIKPVGSPEFGGVTRKVDAVEHAVNSGNLPAIKKEFGSLKSQLSSAQAACEAQAGDYERMTKEANDWKAKQRKALKELWIYRGALIALGLWIFRGFIFGGIMFVARKFVGVPW